MPIRNNTWRHRCGIRREEEILLLLLEGDVHIVDFEQIQQSCWLKQGWCVCVCLDDSPKCERGVWAHSWCGASPKPRRAVLIPVPVPILLMWLPHVHSLASTQLGKLFIRKKIVNHCFYRLPRTSPALHSTPNTVVWGEENFSGQKSGFLVVWVTRTGQMQSLLPLLTPVIVLGAHFLVW